MWRDEAQAWLIVRDLGLGGVFDTLQRYEGHPCLWYLLLFPLAKLGFPYGSIQGVSILAMAAAVWLLATRAPFGKGVKAAWILSGMSLYHLPVIARSYALVPPLLMGIAVLYPRHHQRPLVYGLALLLLSQTHAAMCAFVGGLMLLWALERLALLRKKQVGLA